MVEPYKLWSEYTEEEKKQLPPLNPEKIKNGELNYIWDGKNWEYVPFN